MVSEVLVWMRLTAIRLLDSNDEIEHNSLSYNSINQTKSDKPSEFIDVDFSFNPKQNQHRALGKKPQQSVKLSQMEQFRTDTPMITLYKGSATEYAAKIPGIVVDIWP